jgi:hypothetical protein
VALANDKVVTAENNGDSPLIARATQVGEWEKFRLANFEFPGFSGTSITAVVNGKYVAAEAAGTQPLIARTLRNPAQWEQFFFNQL